MNQKNRGLQIILETIHTVNTAISKHRLQEILLDNDLEVSIRTLERYLLELEEKFLIEKTTHPKGYVKHELVDEKEFQTFMSYLNIHQMSNIAMQSVTSTIQQKKYILTENRNNFKGVEYLQRLLKAIQNNTEVSFTYKTQYTQVGKKHIKPELIKEYENRWYLVGIDLNKDKQTKVYGLDRINNLEIGNKSSLKSSNEEVSMLFNNIIGVDTRPLAANHPHTEEIIIKATQLQPYIFKSMPLHHSQKIIKETDKYTLFKYKLLVNYELLQHFFMYMPFIEVLEPSWLREIIRNQAVDINKTHC